VTDSKTIDTVYVDDKMESGTTSDRIQNCKTPQEKAVVYILILYAAGRLMPRSCFLAQAKQPTRARKSMEGSCNRATQEPGWSSLSADLLITIVDLLP
jgi:hypothetical protein